MRITLDCFPGGRRRALSLSYDDGTIHDRRMVEILDRHGIRGTFHLNAGNLDKNDRLASTEIKTLFGKHEVAAHSFTHPHLTDLPREMVIEEIRKDRLALEELVGYPVRGFSYPYGTYNESVIETLGMLGIEYARTVEAHGKFSISEQFLRWQSTCHHKNDLLSHATKFKALDQDGRMALMYVWGHSFEFDRNQNWDLLEEFCAMISGDSTIWYATTIEIVDYLKALSRLRFSVSGTLAYNPSAMTVWVRAGGTAVEIPAGATVTLC